MPTVRDVMTTKVHSVGQGEVVGRVRDLIVDERIGVVPVLDGAGGVAGVVTASDLVEGGASRLGVADVMSTGTITVAPDAPLTDAARLMLDHRVHHLVVTERDRMVGVVSSFDLIRTLAGIVHHHESAASARVRAEAGDHVVIRGHAVGGKDRRGIITEVRGPDGTPPYRVQWLDDQHAEPHDVLFFPGNDAVVERSATNES